METRNEFKWIGIDEESDDDRFDLSLISEEPMRPIHQILYEQVGDWEAGDRVGEVFGVAIRAGGGRAMCILDFRLDSGDGLLATGGLYAEHVWEGERSIAITGGTGKHVRAAGVVTVESMNPKRYGVSLETGG